MTIKEASQLVIQASALKKSNKGNLFVLDMGEPIKIFDLAKKMVELSGLKWKASENEEGDIEIKIIGLRPGEKLFEELMIEKNFHSTEHPKIIQINEKFVSLEKIKKRISPLMKVKNIGSEKMLVGILKTLVKDYSPSKILNK